MIVLLRCPPGAENSNIILVVTTEARTKGPRVSSIKRGGWNKIIKPVLCSGKSENARWSKREVRHPQKARNARGELEHDVASAQVNWGKDGFRLYYDDS